MRNLYGYNLITLPDQVTSRQIIKNPFMKSSNIKSIILTGYVGHLLNLFAERLNATLKLPSYMAKRYNTKYNTNDNRLNDIGMFYGDMEMLTWNNTIDITGALIPCLNTTLLPYYSNSYVLVRVCLMIPISGNLSIVWLFFYILLINICASYIFTILINIRKYQMYKSIDWNDFIINDTALRGILNNSYPEKMNTNGRIMKLLYILLNTTGLYLNVILNAYLNSMLTHPLRIKQPKTFEDVAQQTNFKLMMAEQDYHFYYEYQSFPKIIQPFITTWFDYQWHRDHLNTSYVYATNNLLWQTYLQPQQRFYSHNLFLYSNEACLPGRIPLTFSLPIDSIYRKPLNRLLLDIRANGLINYWLNTNYMDTHNNYLDKYHAMMATKQKQLTNEIKHHFTMNDFEWIYCFYFTLIIFSLLIFLIENIIYRFKWQNTNKNKKKKKATTTDNNNY